MFKEHLTKKYPEVTGFLTNVITKNKLANSYIFIGKDIDDIVLISIDLAKILNCEKNKSIFSYPCGKCLNCKWLEKGEHPQAILFINPDSKSKKEQIKIEAIRELLNTLKITSDYFKVILFKNSDLYSLPPESGNLLLKTVEEAQERIIFIFANTTRNDILPTILSRSQIIYLNKKHNSIAELINNQNIHVSNNELTDCLPNSFQSAVEKTKMVLEYLNENEIDLKDYLHSLALTKYEQNKYSNQRQYCYLYEKFSTAYQQLKSFMQPKIVLQDLLLKLADDVT